MIYDVLQTLADDLNVYFKTKLNIQEEKVVLSALVNQDGSIALQTENKVIATLINIEKEPFSSSPQKIGRQTLTLNLYVLFSCYFTNTNYSEALRFLDLIIIYFDENYIMSSSTKGSYSGSGKINIEIETFNIDKAHNIWSTLGAKYMPSAVYKIRMIVVESNSITSFIPSGKGLDSSSN
jgi:hypothetical protein